VIGGGDTGNDCVGKAIREGCKSVLQVEFMPKPPEERSPSTPWPDWPYMLRTSYAQHEGGERVGMFF
jgi:NADPH-dependent glutamate synthase beta chain and related oxidoreductases